LLAETIARREKDPSTGARGATITVPRERFGEFEQRFATRAGKVEDAIGFEGFELLRPNDEREVCLVLTRWRSEEDFQAWIASSEVSAGHSQHHEKGAVGTASELWSFGVLERKSGRHQRGPALTIGAAQVGASPINRKHKPERSP
jgi:heme oxygenase (mycobilin-producing)